MNLVETDLQFEFNVTRLQLLNEYVFFVTILGYFIYNVHYWKVYQLLLTKEFEQIWFFQRNASLKIASENSFAEFEQFALKTHDTEWLGKIKIMKTYHHNLPVSIHKILTRTVKDLNIAGEGSEQTEWGKSSVCQ